LPLLRFPILVSEKQAAADQLAKVALSLIDTEPERAFGLVVQSLQGGTVSSALFYIVEKLMKDGKRALLDRLENKIGQVLATNVTLDPYSLSSAGVLGLDKDMPQAAKNGFASRASLVSCVGEPLKRSVRRFA
jgi:hypothetical protein